MNHRVIVAGAMLLFAVMATGCSSQASSPQVALRGRIDATMVEQVASALAQGHRDFTIDSSNGGYVFSAAIISGLLRGRGASLTATGRCWSACTLVLFGVERKRATAEADIRIHGAAYADGRSGDAPAQAAVQFMIANGVPRALAEQHGWGINLYRLTPSDLASAGITAAGPTDL